MFKTIKALQLYAIKSGGNKQIISRSLALSARKKSETVIISEKETKLRPPRIYTRTGDKGTSGLFSGERRPKDDDFFEALGATDELSCAIGLAREFIAYPEVNRQLQLIQCVIQDLQSAIATPKTTKRESLIEKTKWDPGHLEDLERWIDDHSVVLPPLKNFILPSGGKASAALHIARAVCRRAERRVVPLINHDLVDLEILQYLNRLSSYLFTVARLCSHKDGHQEVIYRRPKRVDTETLEEY